MIIAIFGMGLIGGSLGRAIIKKTSHTVLGYDINEDALLKAKMLSACHAEITDENISSADVVILALCPSTAIEVMNNIVPKLKADATVIDCCGNKRRIVAEMEKLNEKCNVNFIGVHPMAGKEYSGISHSTAGLFEHAYIIMTPVHTPIEPLMKIKNLFIEIGCEGIVVADAEKHDRIIAYTSQLAHVVSSSYIKSPVSAEHLGFSAGSFKDMTRVAKLNPDMWTELFLDNRDNLIREIDTLEKHIAEYKQALIDGDAVKLNKLLADGVCKKEIADNLKKENVFND